MKTIKLDIKPREDLENILLAIIARSGYPTWVEEEKPKELGIIKHYVYIEVPDDAVV